MVVRAGRVAHRGRVLRGAVAATFDGTYSHDGVVDVDTLQVWIARKGKPVGHSLLIDGAAGIYDRFFTFRFYAPGESPHAVPGVSFVPHHGHLFLRFVGYWDYRAQSAVPDWDERRIAQNLSRQSRYAVAAIRLYVQCRLPYAVDVHALGVLGDGPGADQYYVWQIAPAASLPSTAEADELLVS